MDILELERETRNQGLLEPGRDGNSFNIVRLVKACIAMKDIRKGSKLHAYIKEHKCLWKNIYVGSTLVSMYAKCCQFATAEQLLRELPFRDVASWNALIAGYARQGKGKEALKCVDDMLLEGHCPSAVTFVCALKACGSVEGAAMGEEIHEKLAGLAGLGMLGKDIVLGTALVDMYMKCGALAKALQVFRELPFLDVASWNALIAGHAQKGQGEEALKCFDDMLLEGHSPTVVTFTCVLKACGNIGATAKGEEIHQKIVGMGMLEKDIVLGNALVDMYVKCGALVMAQKVLKMLAVRDKVAWSALISGYAQKGQGKEALKCFDDVLHEGHFPDAVSFSCALRACGSIGAAAKGEEIHEKIVDMGMLGKDIVLANSLIDMYVKCCALPKAQQVLEELPFRDVVSWSTLIAGYVQGEQGEKALKCFDDMLHEGHYPDVVTFACVVKACGNIGTVAKAEEIYDKIVTLGILEKHTVFGNSLVDMYVKCGALTRAQEVLKELPIRDVVSWSMLIAGYAQQGQGEEALKCFNDMLHERHISDAIAFACALKACGSIGASAKSEEVHDKIVSMGLLEKDNVLGNSLVDMYVKCGALAKAQEVLKELPFRDATSWNALIAVHAQQGQEEVALKCFDDMLCEGHLPNAVTFTCILKACRSIGAVARGEEIHEQIVNMGMLKKDIVLGTVLMDMYVKCGALAKAQKVLEELDTRDMVSWSALIAGYAQNGQGEEALKCFYDMLFEGQFPDSVIFTCVLKACGNIGEIAKGEEIHGKIVSMGMLDKDTVLGTALVDMYVKCNAVAKAQHVLEELHVRDVVSWSVLIAGYAQKGKGEEAMKCFNDMLHEGHLPDAASFACALKACGTIGAAVEGEEIHEKIVNMGMLEKDIVVGNSLIDMYVKCGALTKALQVLKELPFRDVVSWSALVAGYAQQGQGEEALKCFDNMLREGYSPTVVTFICVLRACGSIGAAAKGKDIHDKIVSLGILEKDVVLGNSLVDMYVKCGALANAQQVIEGLSVCDAVSWSALVSGYAQQGQSVEAISCFERMWSNGMKPNLISFTAVFNACNHSGLLDQAEAYYSEMNMKYGIYPSLEHYCCITDVFARAGNLNKALSVIAEMPYDKCLPSWFSLLGACRMCAEVKIGMLAFEHALQLDKSNAAVYILMVGIYTAAGNQEEACDASEK